MADGVRNGNGMKVEWVTIAQQSIRLQAPSSGDMANDINHVPDPIPPSEFVVRCSSDAARPGAAHKAFTFIQGVQWGSE